MKKNIRICVELQIIFNLELFFPTFSPKKPYQEQSNLIIAPSETD